MNERALALLTAIKHGRARRVDQITDRFSLAALQRKGLVFTSLGRYEVPRSSSDILRASRQGGMIQHEEVHLTSKGSKVYFDHFRPNGQRKAT